MLFSLMYHHINGDKYSNDLETFEKHLKYLIQNYNFVIPGDSLDIKQNNVCLTFDDAYYDFYHYVFPLLKQYNLKALLAVPTGLISYSTNASTKQRLSLRHEDIYKDKNYQKFGTFCTWDELKEMSDSGLVIIASHSHKHKDLSHANIDLYQEIVISKKILEKNLDKTINSFILPFGRYNKESLSLLKQHYHYIFKVGQGINTNFNGVNGLIYRIDADDMSNIENLFSLKKILKYSIKSSIKFFYDGIQRK